MAAFSDKKWKKASDRLASAPEQTAPDVAADPVDPLAAVALTPEDMVPPPEVPPAPEPTPPPPAAPTPSHRVRVVADGKLLIGACMHRFRAGNVLDANHYDAGVFKQLLAALKTEPVE